MKRYFWLAAVAAMTLGLAGCYTEQTTHDEWKSVTRDDGNGPVLVSKDESHTVTGTTTNGQQQVIAHTESHSGSENAVGGTR